MGRETSGHDPARGIADDVSNRVAQGTLGGHEPGTFGVGGVRQEQPDSLATQSRQGRQVGRTVVDRSRIELEITGMKHDSFRGVESDCTGVGNRVSHIDEGELEGLDLHWPAGLDRPQVGFDPQLVDAAPCHVEGQPGSVDRNVEVGQKIGKSPDVIFMPVGEDDADNVFLPIYQPAPVRKDQVDAQHFLFGKHQPAVDDGDLAIYFERGTVAADAAESS